MQCTLNLKFDFNRSTISQNILSIMDSLKVLKAWQTRKADYKECAKSVKPELSSPVTTLVATS